MERLLNPKRIFIPEKNVFAKDSGDDFIIIAFGSGKKKDVIFTVNETGKEIWGRLSAKNTLQDIIKQISRDFQCPLEKIEHDVVRFTQWLLKKNLVTTRPVDTSSKKFSRKQNISSRSLVSKSKC